MEHKFYFEEQENKPIQIYTFKNNKKYIINKNTNNDEMNVAIVGSRSISDQQFVRKLFDCFVYIFGKPTKIISGGAKGIDSFAEDFANTNNIDIQIFKPDWTKYGKKAGFIRNEDIIKNCDICLAIWDGKSHGTQHDLELCKQYKKDLVLFNAQEYHGDIFKGFYYKLYNTEQEINFDGSGVSQQQKNDPNRKYNRWLPQPGIISV